MAIPEWMPRLYAVIKAKVPPINRNLKRGLVEEEINAIYKECSKTRSAPEFISDENGKKVGWRKYSIDAWSE